jgi:hypothetical protein
MTLDTVWFLLRIFCIGGCALSLLLLSTARFRQWDDWSVKTQDHWWALAGWCFVGIYGTVELLVSEVQGGSRLIVSALVVALTLRALLRTGELKAHSSFPGKKDFE